MEDPKHSPVRKVLLAGGKRLAWAICAAGLMYLFGEHLSEAITSRFNASVAFVETYWRELLVGSIAIATLALSWMAISSYKDAKKRSNSGDNALKLARLLFSKEVYKSVFEAGVADFQFEYNKAMDANNTRKAFWIGFSHRVGLLSSFILQMSFVILELGVRIVSSRRPRG